MDRCPADRPRIVPSRSHAAVRRTRLPPSGHQFEGMLAIATRSQHEHHLVLGVGREIQMDLQCRARVASRLHVPRETPTLQRRRPSQRALAPDELRAIGRDAVGVASSPSETRRDSRTRYARDFARRSRAGSARTQVTRARIRLPWRCAEDPLGVVGHRQAAGGGAGDCVREAE